jgi:ABC-type glutathione transport system ATPase component
VCVHMHSCAYANALHPLQNLMHQPANARALILFARFFASVGSPLERGISGGQAKRVNIGIAMVSNPRVLYLDEPTSGACGPGGHSNPHR